MKTFLTTLFITSLLVCSSFSRTAEEWKSRSVYQIITDRFARPDGSTQPCPNLSKYCGGTFKGIQANLDYIQGMGFDAIWISPVVANTPDGYHGYWVSNLYEINSNFGTPEELHELIQACHERDIWVMVDVVANHVGYVDNFDYSTIYPFSDPEHYNPYLDCSQVDFKKDQDNVEVCWLSGLPDLNQSHPFVKEALLSWIVDFVEEYQFDALRLDTVPHVSKGFWKAFSKAAGVYTLGEILNTDLSYLAGYQGYVDGVLNYAQWETMNYAFRDGGSMNSIAEYYERAFKTWPDVTLLGNFVDNHDNPRFLSNSSNYEAFKSALAFSMCSVGIPMVYYGDEQAYTGGIDPQNREPLWTSMNAGTDIYQFLKTINQFRRETRFYDYEQVQRYSDNQLYAFSRGNYFFAFTNVAEAQTKIMNSHPYQEGTVICNIFQKGDCVEVKNGEFPVRILTGEAKIYAPSINSDPEEKVWKSIRDALDISLLADVKDLSHTRM